MKLREIYSKSINEEYNDIDKDQYNDIINKYSNEIKEYSNNGVPIFRGMRRSSDIIIADSTNMNRPSANTSNYTTILTSVLPSWKDWPKRNKSFICSTNPSYASGYGTQYYVIPLENQQVAKCINATDFWDTLPNNKNAGSNVSDFNDMVENIIHIVFHEHLDDSNAETIINTYQKIYDEYTLEKLQETYPRIKNSLGYTLFLNELFKHNSALDFFDAQLDPSKHNVILDNYKQLPKTPRTEVWMSGKILLIEARYANNRDLFKF